MSSVPLKTISQIMRKAKEHPNTMACHGRAYRAFYDGRRFTLEHYGTMIVSVDTITGDHEVGPGAFSASDRDAINSVFVLEGIDAKVRIKDGDLIEV